MRWGIFVGLGHLRAVWRQPDRYQAAPPSRQRLGGSFPFRLEFDHSKQKFNRSVGRLIKEGGDMSNHITIRVWVESRRLEEAEALGIDVPKVIEEAIEREIKAGRHQNNSEQDRFQPGSP